MAAFSAGGAFLEWERAQCDRHELLNGEVTALGGITLLHSQLCLRIGGLLAREYDPKECRTYSSDAKVSVDELNCFYPDATVSCQDPPGVDPAHEDLVHNPFLVAEVLSHSTALKDMSEKFEGYRRIASLKHVLYVHQEKPWIEHRRRTEVGLWSVEMAAGLDAEVDIDGFLLALSDVYSGLTLAWSPSSDGV